ncbi:MAG: hypothetical protein [Caudoviricetes sp.]|nr:MAG: hypothetical protein [Caudoviricetes sp.]
MSNDLVKSLEQALASLEENTAKKGTTVTKSADLKDSKAEDAQDYADGVKALKEGGGSVSREDALKVAKSAQGDKGTDGEDPADKNKKTDDSGKEDDSAGKKADDSKAKEGKEEKEDKSCDPKNSKTTKSADSDDAGEEDDGVVKNVAGKPAEPKTTEDPSTTQKSAITTSSDDQNLLQVFTQVLKNVDSETLANVVSALSNNSNAKVEKSVTKEPEAKQESKEPTVTKAEGEDLLKNASEIMKSLDTLTKQVASDAALIHQKLVSRETKAEEETIKSVTEEEGVTKSATKEDDTKTPVAKSVQYVDHTKDEGGDGSVNDKSEGTAKVDEKAQQVTVAKSADSTQESKPLNYNAIAYSIMQDASNYKSAFDASKSAEDEKVVKSLDHIYGDAEIIANMHGELSDEDQLVVLKSLTNAASQLDEISKTLSDIPK